MAKRSPILGYNHNVRYRGLVFHVQTEDSGVLSPHLFTHLFHHGVIVSTRKYVYDSNSTEEAIKALMQAQHKVVLKELKRGQFDDKIDLYLGGTPGLLARGAAEAPDAPEEPTDPGRTIPRGARMRPTSEDGADDGLGGATVLDGEIALSREPTLEEPQLGLRPTEQAVEEKISVPRTTTPEITSRPSQVRTSLPTEGVAAPGPAAQVAAAAAAPTPRATPTPTPRATPTPSQGRALVLPLPPPAPNDFTSPGDSQPEILIQIELDESSDDLPTLPRPFGEKQPSRRRPHDSEAGWDMTRIDLSNPVPVSDGVPGAASGAVTLRNTETGPVYSSGSSGPTTGPLSQRAAKAVGAAALPPARPIARPASRPAMTPSQVAVRPVAPEDRDRRTPPPDPVVEVYTSPPADPLLAPPERPGQYSQHKRISSRIPPGDTMPERLRPVHAQQGSSPQLVRAGSTPVIPTPGRPVSPPPVPQAIPQAQPASAQRSSPVAVPVAVPVPIRSSPSQAIPQAQPASAQRSSPVAIPMPARAATPPPVPATPTPRSSTPPPVPQARPLAAVAPQRVTPIPSPSVRPPPETLPRVPGSQRGPTTPPQPTPVVAGGAGGAPARGGPPPGGSGVVMSRPAVIVGAPAKPSSSTQRVRKAREDEGRGFGQGLISEKSLDEVILAYLSEDAEDK